MKLRPLRQRRRGRVEVIPMIDVMFFLLATFMLASLTLQNLHAFGVTCPGGGRRRSRPPPRSRSPRTAAAASGSTRPR